MMWYPEDEDGWVQMYEQGSEFYIKEFTTTKGEVVLVCIDVYEDMTKFAWYGPGTVEKATTDVDFEFADPSEDNIIISADYTECLGFPPAQPNKGHIFNPWKVINTGAFGRFENGEQILHKFSKLSGFPYASGIFYEEIEDGR